jgi:hypothetical protein
VVTPAASVAILVLSSPVADSHILPRAAVRANHEFTVGTRPYRFEHLEFGDWRIESGWDQR